MKKSIKTAMFAFAVVAATAGAVRAYNNGYQHGIESNILLAENIEALSGGGDWCYAGGRGSTSCSVDAGITILGCGVTGGCSVSCQNGYYACCGLQCTCVHN